eukprot:Nk52_evm9s314 gene=Nk52_evmTU9s314
MPGLHKFSFAALVAVVSLVMAMCVQAVPNPYVHQVLGQAMARMRRSSTCAELLAIQPIPDVAHPFNLFSGQDVILHNSNVAGRSFAMDKFIATQSTFAHGLPKTDCVGQENNPTPRYASAIALVQAKMVDSNAYGHVIYGSAYTGQERLLAPGCKYNQIATDLTAIYSSVGTFISTSISQISAAQALALTAPECASSLNPSHLLWDSLLCVEGKNGLDVGEGAVVIDIAKGDLQKAFSLGWCDKDGKTVPPPPSGKNIILNVRGTGTVHLKANIDQLLVQGVSSNRISWNFFEADKVVIKEATTKGNFVAPNALVKILRANVDGQIAALSIDVEDSTIEIGTRFVPPSEPEDTLE